MISLHTAAKLALVGLAYIYSTRLIDTFCHGIFSPVSVAAIVVGLNILSGVAQLAFFIIFYRQFVPEDRPALMVGAWLAITGSAIALLPKFLAMSVLFQTETLFFFILQGNRIAAFSPWLAAMLLLAFTLIFLADREFRRHKYVMMALVAGAGGWFCMDSIQSLVIINYLTSGRLLWLNELFAAGPIIVVIATSLTFLGLAIFYVRFTRRVQPL